MGKSAERKRNEANIKQSDAAFDKTRKKLESYEFSDQYAGLEAQTAQAGTLGEAATYDAAQIQGGTLGPAQRASAQGYSAAQAQAAQADLINLGEDTGRTNQFANLQVSTAASDRQASETDRALAAQQESGLVTGAGGATALARAAADSKANVSAGLDQQEAQNNQVRAQGATDVQREALAQRNLSRQSDIQQGQFNTGLEQQTNLANQSATNQAAQFGAAAANQASQFNASSANQFAQSQFSADNNIAAQNAAAQNQSYQFGAGAINQFQQAQFGADNQFAAQNAQTQNQFALTRAQGASDLQEKQYNQLANLYSQDAAQKAAAHGAEANRKASKRAAISGVVGSVVGAVGAAASGGAFGGS